MTVYLVGGAVRDRLLGLVVKDRDWVVVGSTVEEMLQLGFKRVGKNFPVFLHPKTKEEYALARKERKTAVGYDGFECYADVDVSLQDDLMRRDLTINALAEDQQGRIIDYHSGIADLNARILRHVSEAFAEDPVRILRIARFAARYAHLGFVIADETQYLMRAMVTAGEVDALVAERVWQECQRALSEKNPDVFFQVLRDCGALGILFAEIDALFNVPQPKKYHPEIDCGIHTLMVLQQSVRLSSQPEMRFAALLHDLGKANTDPSILPHHYGHEKRSLKLIEQICLRYPVPKRFRQLALLVAEFHSHVHKLFELKAKTILKVFVKTDAFRKPKRFEQCLLACKADSRGRTGYEEVEYTQAKHFLAILKTVQLIDVQSIVDAGYRGIEIKEQLYKKRLLLIRAYQQACPSFKR